MLNVSLKPKTKTCRHCKARFMPAMQMQIVCSPMCGLERARIKREAKQKDSERAEFKERKAKLKRIPDLIKEAQTAFNAFIRERDRDQPCICCGKPLGDGDVGGRFDCGHYRSTGSASHLRFDERNAHAQRKACNRWGAGRAVDYRIGLVARLGIEVVEALEANNVPRKWTRDELIAIKAEYVQQLKELRKGQP